jgi:hypothetical protein
MIFNEANTIERTALNAQNEVNLIPALWGEHIAEDRPNITWLHQINKPPCLDDAGRCRRKKLLREAEINALSTPPLPIVYLRCLLSSERDWVEIVKSPMLVEQYLRVFYIGEAESPRRLYAGFTANGGYTWRDFPDLQNKPIITAFWCLEAFSATEQCPTEYFNSRSKRDRVENELICWFDDKGCKLQNDVSKSRRGADKDPIAKAVAQHIIEDCKRLGLVHCG